MGSTVGFVRDGGVLVVTDPGLVPGRDAILRPLAELAVAPEQITDVVLSHHHPDHTVNAALFPNARIHDHWAWYRDDLWVDRPAEGFELSSSIRLIETPGHSPQDVSTLVDTDGGLVVFTHLWWTATVPAEDPFAPDPALLHENRARVLSLRGCGRSCRGMGRRSSRGRTRPASERSGAAERRRDRGDVVGVVPQHRRSATRRPPPRERPQRRPRVLSGWVGPRLAHRVPERAAVRVAHDRLGGRSGDRLDQPLHVEGGRAVHADGHHARRRRDDLDGLLDRGAVADVPAVAAAEAHPCGDLGHPLEGADERSRLDERGDRLDGEHVRPGLGERLNRGMWNPASSSSSLS